LLFNKDKYYKSNISFYKFFIIFKKRNNMIKKILFAVLFSIILIGSINSYSQGHYTILEPMKATTEFAVSNVTGVPFKETSLPSDFVGSRYLFDDWDA